MEEIVEKKNKEFNFFGLTIDQETLAGFIIVFFCIASLISLAIGRKISMTYKNAVSFEQASLQTPAYVTGNLIGDEIGNANIKPGKYLKIEEHSEIFTWVLSTTFKGNNPIAILQWTENPEDPQNFRQGVGEGKKFNKKTVNLNPVTNQTAHVFYQDKKVKINIDKLDFSLGQGYKFEKPDLENLVSGKFDKIGKLEDWNKERILIYESEECETDQNEKSPEEGCERISLSVLKVQEGEFTFLGFTNGDELLPFEDTIKVTKGKFEDFLECYSTHDSIEGFFGNFAQIPLFFGTWIGIFLLAGKIPTIEYLNGFSDLKKAGIIAIIIIIKIVSNPWWGIPLLGILAYVYKQKSKMKVT